MPLLMLLVFGGVYGGSGQVGWQTELPWLVDATIQMAGYGGMMAALGQAKSIVTKRSLGWNRQLRVIPAQRPGLPAV